MRLNGAHLTYCTNIHRGEGWDEVRQALGSHLLEVKRAVCPDQPFGVGLRLGARAARELAAADALDELKGFLQDNDLYVFTLNGFPYGPFHGTTVKERVYRPDWREEERLRYTDALARILAQLLPEGVDGTISTVPGAFKAGIRGNAAAADMAARMLRHVVGLIRIAQQTGKTIALAIEPEPCCYLETTEEAIAFFGDYLFADSAIEAVAAHTGLDQGQAHRAVRQHLGLCLDACHAAVEFEEPQALVEQLAAAGVEIKKLQLSAGLRIHNPGPQSVHDLQAFDDGVYLHQLVARGQGGLKRHADLGPAFQDPQVMAASEWRVHCHVPIFLERLERFDNTQNFLRQLLELHRQRGISQQLEVETYTWEVLPPALRSPRVADDIARELNWVRDLLEQP